MTGAEFSEVDLDLLADYVGGALDGTGDEAVVARLVAEEPRWQEAHAELAAATGAVSSALRSWGAEPEPMPAEIAARLDAALLTAGTIGAGGNPGVAGSAGTVGAGASTGVTGSAGTVGAGASTGMTGAADIAAADAPGAAESGATAAGAPGAAGSAPARHLVAVRDGEDRPTTARNRSRRLRWAAPIGVAAAAIAFLGLGVREFTSPDGQEETTSAAAPGSAERFSLPIDPVVSSSGRNYTADSLAEVPSQIMAAPEAAPDEERAKAGAAADSSLDRLRLPETLLACLEAIRQQHDAGPMNALTVDYGSFTGVPAAIVRFTAGDGTWAWAVGADCGSRGSETDRLAAVRVG